MKPGKKQENPDDIRNEIINQLKEIFLAHGEGISQLQYQALDIPNKPSVSTIRRHFGNWIAFKDVIFGGYTPDTSEQKQDNTKEQYIQDFKDNTGVITSNSRKIKTLDDAIKYFDIDLDRWDIDRYIVNKWEVGAKDADKKIQVTPLVQVKVWLKKKVDTLENQFKAELESLIEEVKVFAPIYPVFEPRKLTGDRHLLEIAIMDLHLAKLCWSPEVGEDYDSKIAETLYMQAVRDLMYKTNGFPIEEIVLPTGNDFFHIDNQINTTTMGTRQDVDSRWQRAFHRARIMLVKAIDTLSAIAPVTVPIIPGNHDNERMYYLGEVLDAWYYHNDRVTIDNSPDPRKYFRYGVNLIGYTHGKEEKPSDLPLIMAREQKNIWGEIDFPEWHIGHTHKKKETHYTGGDTFNGVAVRVIPSLSATDAWHHNKGYVKGLRAAEAYLWHHDNGYVGHFSSNVIPAGKIAS